MQEALSEAAVQYMSPAACQFCPEAIQKLACIAKKYRAQNQGGQSDEPHTVNTWIPGMMDRFLYDHMYLLIRDCTVLFITCP